ncbi:hypothetical protein ACIQI7_10845 [Kitasatospora sp. NPDC092039]|uniref:hypothetical protein n=1 Tax=Kitasatospora sp. NPDC092039 TaxID=3364086 RepID=UPI003826D027
MQDAENKCPNGEEIRPDPPDPDGIATWKCPCGYFGYVLPVDFVSTHPNETRVQVCGRKRRSSVPAPVMA